MSFTASQDKKYWFSRLIYVQYFSLRTKISDKWVLKQKRDASNELIRTAKGRTRLVCPGPKCHFITECFYRNIKESREFWTENLTSSLLPRDIVNDCRSTLQRTQLPVEQIYQLLVATISNSFELFCLPQTVFDHQNSRLKLPCPCCFSKL